jgi:hypothetical protein
MDDDPYLEAATKLHPRKRPVSQSRKTGFLSVDALRERLSNNLPTKDRLSIAQASRQMEILLSRLSAPQEPPVLSAKAKNRVRKNHEASVALHVDRTRAKERTKQEALDKSNFQIFGNYAKEHPMQTTKQEHHHRKENHSDAFHRHIVQKNNYLNDMKNTTGGSYNNDTSLRPQDGYDDVNDNWIKCRTRGDPEKFYFHNTLTGESRWILDENILNKSRRQHQQHQQQQQQQQPHDGHHTKGYSTMLEKNKDDDDNVKKSDEFEVGFKGIRTNVQNNRLKSAPRGGRRDMGDGRRNRDGVGEDGRDFARRELYRPMSSPANLSRSNRKSEIVDFDLGVGNDIVYEDTDDSSTDDDKEYDQYNRRKIIDVRIGDRNGGGGGRNGVRRERGENDENVEKSAMSPPRINQQNNPQNRSPSPQRSKSPLKKTNKKKNANMMTANERRKYVKELKDAEEEANKQKNKQRKQSKEEKEGKKRLAMLQSKSFSLFVDRRRAPKEREAQILERQAQMKASAPPPIPPENKRLPQPIKEQLVGDEEKSGSGLVSDWLKIPEVSRTLLEKKRLAIVVACYDGSTSFNHPCVYERYKNSANSVINVIKEFTDDCAGISGYSIVEKGDVAGSLEIYAAIHSEVSVPLPAAPLVTTDASKRMGTSPSTYPHLVATRASATIMKTQPIKPPVERNIHTKLLFSKKLAGGWPDPKRCRRKLKRWLKKDVGIDISSIAHFRAREAEKAMTDHVHINFPIQYLANWVKILDVPWNDGVRFEYEGPREEEEEEKEEEGGEGNVDKNDPNRVPLIEREGHDENNHNEKDDLIINGDKKGHHQTSPSKKNQKNKIGDKKRLTLKELKKNRKSKAKSSEQSDIKADRKGKMTKDDDEEEYKAPFRVGGPLKHDDLHYFKNYSSSEEEEEVDEDGNVTRKSRKGPKEKIAKLMYKWRGAAHVVTAFNKKREYHLATTSDVLHQQHDLDKLTDEATKQSERAASSITNPVDGALGDQMPVPTRTVHTCIIPRNVKHLLMGCADGVAPSSSSSQDPTQTMNDKLAICAIAPPYHCFQSCENETESRQYRGVRWHCRAPSMKDSGFGHDFGFSNSNEVVIKEGRGDVWFSSNVVEINDNRKECSGERSGGGLIDDGVTLSYSVDDKKTASLVDYEYVDEQEMKEILDEVTLFSPFGAVSRPLKNANRPKEFQRFKEHQIFVQQQQKQFEEQLAQQTSSITDQMGDNKSSSKIEEILPDNRNPRYLSQTKDSSWDRMSWGGAGGGRCGEPISDLHAPSHPWEIGTQVQMLQSAGVFSEGQIVIVMEYHINASSSSVHEKINQSPTDKRQTQNDINAKEDEKRNVAFEEVKKPSSSSLSSPILTPNKYIYHMKSEDGSFDWLAASDHGTLFRLQNFHDIRFEGLRKVIYIRLPDQLILPDEVNLEELRIENRRLQIEQEQDEAEVNLTQDVVGIAEKVSPVLLETSLPFSSSPLPQSSINSHMLPSVQSIEKKKELNVELVKSPESTQGEDPSYENDFYFEDTYEEDFASKQRQHQNDVEEKHEVKQDQHQQEDKENDDLISIKQQQQQQGQKLDNDLKEERAATTIQCNTRKQQAKQEVNKIWMNHQVEVARKEQEREQLVLKERERKLNLQLEAQEACSQAAIMIQALLRQYKEKLRYSQERKAIILIQRIARQRQARKFVNNKQEEKKSAVVIQGMFRQKKAKETVKYKKEVKIQNSAIKIQSLYGQKNSKIKMQNKRKEKAANKIQNAARIKQAKKRNKEKKTGKA